MVFAAGPRYAPEMIALSLALAAAAPPQPNPIKTFQDWTVGCDNGRACQAVALVPEHWPDDALTMSVRRGAEAGAQPVVAFELGASDNAVSVSADGRRLPARLVAEAGEVRVAPADTAALIGALRSAGTLQVQGASGKPLGTLSLKGASAALLYMDEQQRRIGGTTALVRPGPRSAVPAPPPLPVVTAPAVSRTRPAALSAAAIRSLRAKHGCSIGDVGGPDDAESATLTSRETLLLLACGSGAYNVSFVPFIVRRGGHATIAPFDHRPGWWAEEGKPMLVNAAWDEERGVLTSFSKGRGLGDCGIDSDYAWDGRAFRLVRQSEMVECRGSRDYITTWRARLVRR